MANHRRGRINDALAEELALALREVRDPRVHGNLVSITRAEVAPDLRNARVFFSAMGDQKEALEGLRSASGILRRHLAQTLNLRLTPELSFQYDASMEHGAHIARLLRDIAPSESKTEDESN